MGGLQQVGGQAAPEQGDGAAPAHLGQAFQGPEFHQTQAAGRGTGIPELVETDFAAMVVAAAVGMQMAQGFADQTAMVAAGVVGATAVIGLLQGPVGQLQIKDRASGLVGPWRLGGRTHAGAAEQVGQRRVVLPVAQDAHQPGRPAEEGMVGQVGSTPEQVVAATGALLAATGRRLPAAQALGGAGLLQQGHPAVVIGPAMADRQIDLEHTGIGRQPQHLPVAIGIHRQHTAEPRRRQLAQAVGHGLQQRFQRAAGEGRQEQLPTVGADFEGEHLAWQRRRHVLQRQTQAGRSRRSAELPQRLLQGPGRRPPGDRAPGRIAVIVRIADLIGIGAQRHSPDPPLAIEGIAQGQRFELDPQALAELRQPGLALISRQLGAAQPRLAGPGPAHGGAALPPGDQAQGPAGIHLAVVTLARAVQHRAAGPGTELQLLAEATGDRQLGGAVGGDAPLGPLGLERHEGGLTAEGQLDAGLGQPGFGGPGCGFHPGHRPGVTQWEPRCTLAQARAAPSRSARRTRGSSDHC